MKKHIKKLVSIMAGGIAAISLMASTHNQVNRECHASDSRACTFLAHAGCTVTESQGTVSDCVGGYDPGDYQGGAPAGTRNCTWTETHSQTGVVYNRPSTPQAETVEDCEDECYPDQ